MYRCNALNHAGEVARPRVPIRRIFSTRINATPPAAAAILAGHRAGYARTNPTQMAMASTPLHASVTSIGTRAGPKNSAAARPWSCVSGRTAAASTPCKRKKPKTPTLHAMACSAKLEACTEWDAELAVRTGDLLYRDLLCAKDPAQRLDRRQAFQPRRTGKNVDIDRPGLGPGVYDRMRLFEDQDTGQPAAGEPMVRLLDDGRAGRAKRRRKRVGDGRRIKSPQRRAPAEVGGVQDGLFAGNHALKESPFSAFTAVLY